ncbi:metallophosphoesterase [Deinococcus arenicola]|uniref:Metallophosphoesterase n=1 Tax=Deinococcus arenicola TaxID=2994950 RepID=A0ABU4DQS2_9DEIO|nr:metallophosphoesterase [Deinococcus sp. ZS9-10]MDV6374317.1 metallophosphoesterase [Deinococcus sp. ZS9-10]
MRPALFWLTPALLLCACTPILSGPVSALPDVTATLTIPDPEHLRVVVMGDQGTGTEVQKRVAAAMETVCAAQGCDLGVGLGDNFYPAGPKQATSPLFKTRFADVYSPLKIPFLMVAGNHDQSGIFGGDGTDARGAEAEVAYSKLNPQWVMPGRTYRATLQPGPGGTLAEFFAMDTSPLAAYLPGLRADEWPGGPWDAAQRAWLTQSMQGSPARWKLVLGHHPLFSNAKHGDAGTYDGLPFAFQRGDAVHALYGLACGKADLLLSGHDHALQVFAPQPECPGTWTAVSGAAGKTEGGKVGHRPAAAGFYGQPGFLWLDVTPQTLTLQTYTVAADGVPVLAATQDIRKTVN